jgi:hypothetical protein
MKKEYKIRFSYLNCFKTNFKTDKIQEYFESIGMTNESKAFEELIERKFNDNSPNVNKK